MSRRADCIAVTAPRTNWSIDREQYCHVHVDVKAAASLGAVLPTTNTALANWVRVVSPSAGAAVTGRKIYRSKRIWICAPGVHDRK